MKPRIGFGLVAAGLLLTGLMLSWVLSTAMAQQPARPPIQKWQHMALTHNGADVSGDGNLSGQITKIGNEGWELVSVSSIIRNGTTEGTVFYFKRPAR